jgi:hypothetical protein
MQKLFQNLTEEQRQLEVDKLEKEWLFLSNDCGGCETCLRVFSPEMHSKFWAEVKNLPKELQEKFENI